jgi:hypothetical protein
MTSGIFHYDSLFLIFFFFVCLHFFKYYGVLCGIYSSWLHFSQISRGPAERQCDPEDIKKFDIESNFECYGNIAGKNNQITAEQDQELANVLRKKMKNTLVPRINWPTREVKPISEFSNTKLLCLAFPWLFPAGVGDIKECQSTSHATVGLRRYSAGHRYKWKYGRVDRKGLLCVSFGGFAAFF